jgi:hypothetical protein
LAWLIPRDSLLKRRFTVIDAVPTLALAPLRDAIRARAEKCLLLLLRVAGLLALTVPRGCVYL